MMFEKKPANWRLALGLAAALLWPPLSMAASDWKAVACGGYAHNYPLGNHSLALKANGDLYGTGMSLLGELGVPGNISVRYPHYYRKRWKRILRGVTAMEVGLGVSLALRRDGELWSTGANWRGQLGNGGQSDKRVKWKKTLSNVKAMAGGHYASYALKEDGTLWVAGATQVGDETEEDWNSMDFGITYSRHWTPFIGQVSEVWVDGGWRVVFVRRHDQTLWHSDIPGSWNKGGAEWQRLPVNGLYAVTTSNYYRIPEIYVLDEYGNLTGYPSGLNTSPAGAGSEPVRVASNVKAVRNGFGLFALDTGGTLRVSPSADPIDFARQGGTMLPLLDQVVSFCITAEYGLAVRQDGTLWGAGTHQLGEFGDGTWGSGSAQDWRKID